MPAFPAVPTDRSPAVLSEVRRLATQVRSVFAGGVDEAVGRLFPEKRVGTRAIVGAGARLGSIDVSDLERSLRDHREKVVKEGLKGLDQLDAHGDAATLDPTQLAAVEILYSLTARPALGFDNGHFDEPQPPWTQLDDQRPQIEMVAAAVGRIQVQGNRRLHWAGTGFLVADDVVMTNIHVADVFGMPGARSRWRFKPGMGASIDWWEDPDAAATPELDIVGIVGVHPTFDLALLRVSTDGGPSRMPLTVARQAPDPMKDAPVYVVGYPAHDPRNGGEAQRLIFADKYDIKRLQPGTILGPADRPGVFNHDCSTLGGNSGSCVVSLATHQVVGLHFQGEYLKYNQAIALWDLAEDPLLTKAGVNFAAP